MAGTIVTYNGVELRNVLTASWEESVHMDESNTDEVYVIIKMRFQGIVHAGYPTWLGISSSGASNTAAANYNSVGARLSNPRADLTVRWNDDAVLTVVGTSLESNQRDVNNGPKPKVLSIQNIAGSHAITVDWECEVAIPRCSGNTVGDPQAMARVLGNPEVISNRWAATETKDENFYSRIEYKGTLIVRRITKNADLYRAVVVPPLRPGFQREQLIFHSTPDGLQLQYTIVDKQQYAAPPPPATSWQCKYTVETNNGASIFSTVQVELIGPPGTDQRQLLVAALQVCEARLGNLALPPIEPNPKNENKPARKVFVRNAQVVEDVSNNKIQVTVKAQEVPNQQGVMSSAGLALEPVGQKLRGVDGYNPVQWPLPSLYNSQVGAFAFKLANACMNQIPSLAGQQATPVGISLTPGSYGGTPPATAPAISSYQSKTLPPSKPQISDSQFKHQYTLIEIYNKYEVTTGNVQQPIAKSNPDPNNPKAPTSAFSVVHQPLCRRIFRMKAERAFTNPQLPPLAMTRKDINGIEETLLSYQIIPRNPELLPDGKNYVYYAQIELVYGLERCPDANELYIAGASQMDLTTGYLTALPDSALSDQTIQGGSST